MGLMQLRRRRKADTEAPLWRLVRPIESGEPRELTTPKFAALRRLRRCGENKIPKLLAYVLSASRTTLTLRAPDPISPQMFVRSFAAVPRPKIPSDVRNSPRGT
eukprot:4920324-Pleurochrysis_carterae.AAC.1